jgi:hypothetical protein
MIRHLMCALFILSLTAAAVEARSGPELEKFDSYSKFDVANEATHLDNVAVELIRSQDLKVVLVFYGGRHSVYREAVIRGERAQDYLVNTRGIAAARVVTIDGGYQENPWVEVWALPKAMVLPKPTPSLDPAEVIIDWDRQIEPRFPPLQDVCQPEQANVEAAEIPGCGLPRKFDEWGKLAPHDEMARLDNIAAEAKRDPEATVIIFVYGGRHTYKNEADRRLAHFRDYLSKVNQLPLPSIVLANPGYLENQWVEVWLFPRGIEPPTGQLTIDRSGVVFDARRPSDAPWKQILPK